MKYNLNCSLWDNTKPPHHAPPTGSTERIRPCKVHRRPWPLINWISYIREDITAFWILFLQIPFLSKSRPGASPRDSLLPPLYWQPGRSFNPGMFSLEWIGIEASKQVKPPWIEQQPSWFIYGTIAGSHRHQHMRFKLPANSQHTIISIFIVAATKCFPLRNAKLFREVKTRVLKFFIMQWTSSWIFGDITWRTQTQASGIWANTEVQREGRSRHRNRTAKMRHFIAAFLVKFGVCALLWYESPPCL